MELIEIEDESGILIKDKFENFLKNTNLSLEGNIQVNLRDRNKLIFYKVYATMYFYNDLISVETCKNDLNKVKKLFEDFVKICPIRVRIRIVRGDC